MFKEIIEQIKSGLHKNSSSINNINVKWEISELQLDNREGGILFTTIVNFLPSDTNELIYYNFYIRPNDGINIIVHGKFGIIICRRYAESIDDFESTIFQFSTMVNMYDLDETYYSVLLEMRDIVLGR